MDDRTAPVQSAPRHRWSCDRMRRVTRLPFATLLVFALACGFSVANIYYAQPLLETMAVAFHISPASIGIVVTLTQLGYAAGLVFIVLARRSADRRSLVTGQTLLVGSGAVQKSAPRNSGPVLLAGMVAVGLLPW